MAVLDMFDRPIEKGDLIIFLSGVSRPFQVANLQEPSMLAPEGQSPAGVMDLICGFQQIVPNPQRSRNVKFSDIAIVMKGTDATPGNPKQ